MKDLEDLVDKLAKERGEKKQIAILQEIGTKLIAEYEIHIADLIIEPLWLEAYYFDVDNGFIDPFVHRADEQKGKENCGKLYFHHKTDDARGGVDICLSCGTYYLSFLLKYTLVNGEYTTQSQLSGKIRAPYSKLEEKKKAQILCKKANKTNYIVYTSRIGLDSTKENNSEKRSQKEAYQSLPLAIVCDFHKKFSRSLSLPGKEKLIKQYLHSSSMTAIEKAAFCREYLGYCPSEYKE